MPSACCAGSQVQWPETSLCGPFPWTGDTEVSLAPKCESCTEAAGTEGVRGSSRHYPGMDRPCTGGPTDRRIFPSQRSTIRA